MRPSTTFASVTVGSVPPRPYDAGPGSAPALCGPTFRKPARSIHAMLPPPLPIDNEPDVEARPADVGREHVRVTEHLPEVSRADHAARRTGRQEVRGALA